MKNKISPTYYSLSIKAHHHPPSSQPHYLPVALPISLPSTSLSSLTSHPTLSPNPPSNHLKHIQKQSIDNNIKMKLHKYCKDNGVD